MNPPPDDTTPAGERAARAGHEAKPEDLTEVVLTEWVKGCAAKTSRWLDESSKAFERHLHKALHPPGYTTAEIVKDVTDVWTRNLAYLVSLFTIAEPAERRAGTEAGLDANIDVKPTPPTPPTPPTSPTPPAG